jgi:hypothetical protein
MITIRRKYIQARWSILCQLKNQGGMGIINIDVQNQYLLSKWLHKLINENGLWQDLLRKNYLQNKSIGQVQRKLEDSHFWLGVMKVKEHFLGFGTFHLNNGENIMFWEDK